MKIYIDLAKQAITNTTDEKVYEGDFYSNVFEVLFYNYEDTNWFPTMSQLAPNGRKAGDFTADALGVGESHTYVEDGKTYLRFTFTMGATWVLMKGRSNFYIWLNRLNGTVLKKCVGMVTVMIDQSTDNYFIADPLFNPAVKTYIDACVAEIGDGSPKYFDTAANIALLTEDKGLAVATDTGHLYYWNSTSTSATKYTDSSLVYNDLSAYYTKTESDNRYAQLGANNTFTGDNDFRGESLFSDDINQASGDFSSQGNVEAHSFTKQGTNLDDIYASKSDTYTKDESDTLLNDKADKTNTYTKSEVNTALNLKADKSTTYTKTETNNLLSAKADKTTVNGIDNRVGALENEITDLQSVQNVVDVVATKSALNSYDTSKLEENDKIQVIADETHGGASTIYNWSGSAWQYVGAYGTNSYTKDETLEQIDLHKLVNKTYSELATLKSGNNLVPGQLYRITDYVTTTNGKCNNVSNDVRSMEHPFDIVLRAISSNKFSENARALLHSGDTYFANSNLNSWQLWYCFENDVDRFEWADTLTGKGVIYRMIDEFGNDLPYDFKNIQFKRYKITATTDTRHSNAIGKYLGFSGNYNCTSDNTDYQWYFTFSKRADGTDLSLTETTAPSYTNCYYVKEVKIGEYLSDTPNYRGIQALNNIVFECDNIVVDVQMGVCSHHNTFIGNKDITYVYFKEMCRNNIVYGEMSHARADECFEQNMMGDFVALSQYTLCWNKFSHHFARNIAVQMQSNDFEAQVSDCKFPENFTRNHIFNMWGSVDASTHDTFNRCELGLFSYTTLSGGGTWDGVYGISLDHCTIKIANLFGSKLGRMEYVSISEGVNNYNILNLTVGALFGSSSTPLTIALTDLYSYNLTTAYEKRLDYALEPINSLRVLVYSVKVKGTYLVQDKCVVGTINGSTGNVTWALADTTEERIQSIYNGLFNTKMAKLNPTGSGAISMNDGNASGNSYANGSGATASGNFSRAIGFGAQASGNYSLAVQGNASGTGAIAIGNGANASGDNSLAFGPQCKAKGNNQVVTGQFNIPDTSSLEIIGNGAYMNTSNARLLDANGNEYLKGDIYVNSTFTKDANGDLDTKSGTKLVAVSANPTLAGTEADLTGLEVDGTKYKVSSGGGSGTTVVANPTLQGGEADLTSITIGNTNYAIPSGSGGGKEYIHKISLSSTVFGDYSLVIKNQNNTPFTLSVLTAWLLSNGYVRNESYLSVSLITKGTDDTIVTGISARPNYSNTLYLNFIYFNVDKIDLYKSNDNPTITDTVTEV